MALPWVVTAQPMLGDAVQPELVGSALQIEIAAEHAIELSAGCRLRLSSPRSASTRRHHVQIPDARSPAKLGGTNTQSAPPSHPTTSSPSVQTGHPPSLKPAPSAQ